MRDDKMLWDYLDEESDALLLELRERVEKDGFHKAMPEETPDTLALNLLVMTQVKLLVLMCERAGHPSPTIAFMDVLLPQIVHVLNYYTLQSAEKKETGRGLS